jgi:murein DD-endopeptidase MepM/ murein hydrolase activator NlpD
MPLYRSSRHHALGVALSLGLLTAAVSPLLGWTPSPVLAADSAVVSNPDGINLRESPGYAGAVVGTLDDGTWLELRINEADTVLDSDGSTRWWPVSSPLGNGWVAGFNLSISGWSEPTATSTSAGDATTSVPVQQWATPSVDGEYEGSEYAQVSEPDGANLRSQPGLDGDVLWVVGYGTDVGIRLSSAETVWADGSRWWPVRVSDTDGWMAGEVLSAVGSGEASDNEGAPDLPETIEDESAGAVVSEAPASSKDEATPPSMAWGRVSTEDGSGINLRADPAPDAERIGKADEFDVVEVVRGPVSDPVGNGWFLVKSDGVTGWAFGDYLAETVAPGETVAAPGVATGAFRYPVERFQFTQGFGCSQYWWHYSYNAAWSCHMHNGIDLAAPYGTPILAADGGVVEQAGWCNCGLGWYIKIDHKNGLKTVYGHLAEYHVTPGQAVSRGDVIGAMGSTGNSTGSHLHFSTEYLGVDYNPFNYLP